MNATYARKKISSKINFWNGWKFSKKCKIQWFIKANNKSKFIKIISTYYLFFLQKKKSIPHNYFSFGNNYNFFLYDCWNNFAMISSKTLSCYSTYTKKKKSFVKYLSREGSEWSLESFHIYFWSFIYYKII